MTATIAIEVRPLSPALGAEITGVDLRDDLDDATFAAIEDAWHQNLVILFRAQELSEADQLRFARRFGELALRNRPKGTVNESDDHDPAVMLITNIRENGKPIGSLPDGEMTMHSDMAYLKVPCKATMLYAIDVPPKGGDTVFANLYKAYDALAPEVRDRLKGHRARQVYSYGSTNPAENKRNQEERGGALQQDHPLFVTHPATGKLALFVSRLLTTDIIGLDAAENRQLLDQLFDLTERDDFVYAHKWRPGDLIMWDNRCTNHGRTDFDPAERRLLRRLAVVGEELV